MIYNKIEEKELHMEDKIKLLLVIPLLFLIFAVINSIIEGESLGNIWNGVLMIVKSPSILLTDYVEVGGISAALINAAIIGTVNLLFLRYYKMRINGLLIAAIFTVLGFSLFGKNIFNIVPIYIGGYLYSKYQNIRFKDIILVIMFGTALAPIVSMIIFSDIFANHLLAWGIGLSVGVLIGFVIVPLSSHMLKFHEGYNLYNIGFTAGILGTVLTSILRSFKIKVEPVSFVYLEHNMLILILLIVIFVYILICGIIINPKSIKEYGKITRFKGRAITDFTQLVGYGLTFFNIGLLGLVCIIYVIAVGGIFNGPVIAGIFTVAGFGAFGKHLKNATPIALGVLIAALFFGYDLGSTSVIISVLFSTTIAPLAGAFGPFVGIISGMLHLALVTNIGIVHGGINLYNNGFSGGVIAAIMLPIVDAFKKGE